MHRLFTLWSGLSRGCPLYSSEKELLLQKKASNLGRQKRKPGGGAGKKVKNIAKRERRDHLMRPFPVAFSTESRLSVP